MDGTYDEAMMPELSEASYDKLGSHQPRASQGPPGGGPLRLPPGFAANAVGRGGRPLALLSSEPYFAVMTSDGQVWMRTWLHSRPAPWPWSGMIFREL